MSAPLKDKDCIIAIFDSYAKTVMRNECRDAVDQEKRKRKKEQVGTEKMQYLFETQVHEDRLRFEYQSGIVFIQLPSGRRLAYAKPRMGENRFGGEAITYEGVGTGRKWERLETYGAKCVENIVQGTARDLLAFALLRLEKAGYPVVMHCHDEAICEVPIGQGSVEDVNRIMAVTPEWAEGLPLKADGFETEFYKKD